MLSELEVYTENSRFTGSTTSQQQPCPPLTDLEFSDMTGYTGQNPASHEAQGCLERC